MKIVLFMLLPLVGLAVAIVYRRSFAARIVGVSLAFLAGVLSIGMLFVAHRLAETHLDGRPPSEEWQQGVHVMRVTVLRPLPVLFTVVTVLAVIALMPDRAALESNEESRPQR